MANVVTHPHLQVGFNPRPVCHSPTPIGFGFGLSATPVVQGWPSASHAQAFQWATHQQPPQPQLRVAKRRHEPEEGDRDDAMERSPTPERVRRSIPKRARTTPTLVTVGKEPQGSKESKPAADDNDVDVGFLLGMLPSIFFPALWLNRYYHRLCRHNRCCLSSALSWLPNRLSNRQYFL